MAVSISNFGFWDMTPWSLVDEYQWVGGTCYLHFQG